MDDEFEGELGQDDEGDNQIHCQFLVAHDSDKKVSLADTFKKEASETNEVEQDEEGLNQIEVVKSPGDVNDY